MGLVSIFSSNYSINILFLFNKNLNVPHKKTQSAAQSDNIYGLYQSHDLLAFLNSHNSFSLMLEKEVINSCHEKLSSQIWEIRLLGCSALLHISKKSQHSNF